MTSSKFRKTLLNSLLSLVLVVGLMPTLAWATPTETDTLQPQSIDQAVVNTDDAGTATLTADESSEGGELSELSEESTTVEYSQANGYEAYTGWQGTPWPDETQSSTGGTSRKGWPAWSLVSPLSQGVTTYAGGATVYGTDGVKVVTDLNTTNTTEPTEATRADGWYYKNIILPSVDVTGDTVSFQLTGVAPGGITTAIASNICIATSEDASTWGTAGAEGSTIVWQATANDIAIATAGSNWWKVVTVTASTASLQADQTYYLVLRDDMTMGNVNSYADYVFEFSTDMNRTATWVGDATKAGAVREQGNGSIKLGFQSPTPAQITTDLTKIASCFYNEATEEIAIADGVTTFQVHSDGSGSNWQNIAGWNDTAGAAGTNIFVYDTDPCANGSYDVSSLTPVASMANETINFTLVNPEREFAGRDGVNVNVSGLAASSTYYLVFNENFKWNNGQGTLEKPIVLKFTTAAPTPAISLSANTENVKTGDEIAVSVDMTAITAAVKGTLTWSDNLQLVKIEKGSALAGSACTFTNVEGSGLFSFMANEGTTDGTVAVATFKCVAPGETTIGLTGAMAGKSAESMEYELTAKALEFGVGLSGIAGDVNNSGKVNIVDAQVAYDLGTGKFTDETLAKLVARWGTGATVDMVKAFADVNADGAVDAIDAFAIQYAVHHNGTFGEKE